MLIATLDFPVRRPDVADGSFDRPDAVSGAELCVGWPQSLLAGLRAASETSEGRRVPSPTASQALLARVRETRDRFRDLLARGGTLAVLVPAAPPGGVHTLQEVVDFDPLEILPELRVRCRPVASPSGGPRWERGQPFGAFFDRHGASLAPGSTLDGAPGRVIARDARGEPLACFAYLHPGRLLLLPAPAASLDAAARGALLDGIVDLARRLDPSSSVAALPEWATRIELPGETALRSRIARHAQAVLDAGRALQSARTELSRIHSARRVAVADADAVLAALPEMLVRLGALPHVELGERRALAFESDTRAGVLLVEPNAAAPPDDVSGRARAAAQRASAELGAPAAPIVLDVGENLLPPEVRRGPRPALLQRAREAGVAVTTGEALLRAWASGDRTFLDGLLDAARA